MCGCEREVTSLLGHKKKTQGTRNTAYKVEGGMSILTYDLYTRILHTKASMIEGIQAKLT
jgi:hypothetical protein